MIPRHDVYKTYWYFASERFAMFQKRLLGEHYPWTDDPILTSYKFCNTFRVLDRVSQYLIRHVIYTGSQKEEEVLFRILLFKFFNKIETWEFLKAHLGEITLSTFSFALYDELLQSQLDIGKPIYSNAYISCANKVFGYDKKHQNQLMLLHKMIITDRLDVSIPLTTSMKDLFHLLRAYPLIGDFLAYQLATDINYSEVVDFSETEFTVVGPGSRRGIEKCFLDTGGKSYEYIIRWMQEHQEQECQKYGLNPPRLFGRPLQLIDCQGLFCETDKYARSAFPDIKSNRVRIKATYQPDRLLPAIMLPPKWKCIL